MNPNKALWEKGDFTRIAETMRENGPTMNAFDAAEKNGKGADLQRALENLFTSQNQSKDNNTTSIPATFLRVTVVR